MANVELTSEEISDVRRIKKKPKNKKR